MFWDGKCWVRDDTLRILDLARGICRESAAECKDAKVAIKVASKATSAAVVRLASADRRHAATAGQWDSDPWLVNTPTGTVDLRTGEVREHRRDDYITKITASGPGGDCPLWRQLLAKPAPTSVDTQLSPGLAPAPTTPEDAHLGDSAPESTQRPQRAAAAAWEEVKIVFTSDHQVQVWCGKNSEILNYAEFGFEDRWSGNPNQAWLLLRALAEHCGIIRNGEEAGQVWPKVEKRIQQIRAVLRSHFGNSTDPIPFVEGTGYQARFKISCARSYHT
jgi:hypothetical protein